MGTQPQSDDEMPEEEEEYEDDEPNLGPDERDLDLLDGSWEQEYYSGRMKTRNWNAIGMGVALIVLVAFVAQMFLVVLN